MGRYNTDEYIAAFNRLPWQPTADLGRWTQNKRLKDSGLSDAVMDVLDGLAAMCVRESSESYSTALVLAGDAIRLFVASSCGDVPDCVEQHLQSVWRHMRAMHDHEDARAVRRGDWSSVSFTQLCRNLDVEQCRFAMPALRARLTDEAAGVVRALRSVLGCHAPHTAEVAVLLQGCGYVHQPISDAEMQFLERCLSSLEDLRRIAAQDDLTDESILVILRTMTSLTREVKHMLSQNAKIFMMVEAICDIPIRCYLQRILWLSDPCSNTPALALSSELAPWMRKRLLVVRVPSVLCQPPVFNPTGLAPVASLVFTKDREGQSEDIRLCLVEPLQALLREREALVTSDVGSPGQFQLHSEMALLHHIDSLPQKPVQYIGHSEQCCLPCYLFLSAYNRRGARPFHVRGHHGRTPLCWAAPELNCSDMDSILSQFSLGLADSFFRAWGSCAKAQEVKRGVCSLGNDDEGDDDDTDSDDYGGNSGDSDSSDYFHPLDPDFELPLLAPLIHNPERT